MKAKIAVIGQVADEERSTLQKELIACKQQVIDLQEVDQARQEALLQERAMHEETLAAIARQHSHGESLSPRLQVFVDSHNPFQHSHIRHPALRRSY